MTKEKMQKKVESLQKQLDVANGLISQLTAHLNAVQGQINQLNTPAVQDLLQDLEATREHPTPNDVPHVNRRLRIHVPTPESNGTSLGMGQALENLNYDGFGVDTDGAVTLNAHGGKEKGSMSLLANGPFLVQSDEDSLYLVSKAPAVLASSQVANITGSGGVVIAGGLNVEVLNPSIEGKAPKSPEATKHMAEHMDMISKLWSGFDAIVAGSLAVRNIRENGIGGKSVKQWLLNNAGNVALAGNVADNVLGIADQIKKHGPVTVHGTAGWIMGTPLYGSLYAGAGMTVMSAFPAIIGLKDAEIFGLVSTNVTSPLNVIVHAGKRAELISGTTTDIASRKKEVKLSAPEISIGEFVPLEPKQLKTERVQIDSNASIHLSTDPDAKNKSSTGIYIDSKEALEQHAQKRIQLRSKQEVLVDVDDETSIKVLKEGNVITIRAKNAIIRLSPRNDIELTAAAGGGVVIRKDEIWAGFGEGSKVHIKRSGSNKITGNKINLG